MLTGDYSAAMAVEWDEAKAQEIGGRIKAARNSRGLSLTQVAGRMGVSKGTAGHWETGARTIKVEDLHALCELLSASADHILFGRRQWPFSGIDVEAVQSLDPAELKQIEGAIRLVAGQLGLDLQSPRLPAVAPIPANVAATLKSPRGRPRPAEGETEASPEPRSGRGRRIASAPPPKRP